MSGFETLLEKAPHLNGVAQIAAFAEEAARVAEQGLSREQQDYLHRVIERAYTRLAPVDERDRLPLPQAAPEQLIEDEEGMPLRLQERIHMPEQQQQGQEVPTLWQRICAVVERCFIAVIDFLCTYLCCPPRAQLPVEPAPVARNLGD